MDFQTGNLLCWPERPGSAKSGHSNAPHIYEIFSVTPVGNTPFVASHRQPNNYYSRWKSRQFIDRPLCTNEHILDFFAEC